MSKSKPFILGLPNKIHNGSHLSSNTLYDRVGQNSGNLAFSNAVFQQVCGIEGNINWYDQFDDLSNFGTTGVIPAANQFGEHANLQKLSEKFSNINTDLIMIGLGAQSTIDGKLPNVPEGTVNWVKQIAMRRKNKNFPNIAVRGPITKNILSSYGFENDVEILGCPSLFTNPSNDLGLEIQSNIRRIKRVAVAAGHEKWNHLARIERSLTNIISATGGSYVGQSAFNMFQLTRGEARLMDETDLRACRDYACPEMDLEEFIRWSERHGNLFFDVQAWMEHYRRFDFVIGARIHGVMLALQAGIPGVVIAHDSRTLELCQTMMVPYVLASEVSAGITREMLPDLFKFDGKAFDENRRSIAKRYVAFLESNELTPVGWLKDIAKAAA